MARLVPLLVPTTTEARAFCVPVQRNRIFFGPKEGGLDEGVRRESRINSPRPKTQGDPKAPLSDAWHSGGHIRYTVIRDGF